MLSAYFDPSDLALTKLFTNSSGRNGNSPIKIYLEHTTKCLDHVEVMTSSGPSSPKFNREQCEYLNQKLKVSVQKAHLFFEEIKAWYTKCAPLEDKAKSLEIFKLLYVLSKKVESFVQSCCKKEWIHSAIMLKNATGEHTLSLGFNLDFCTFVFSAKKDLRVPVPSLSKEELVRRSQAEAATVKEMVKRDEGRLSADLRALFKRSSETKQSSRAEKQLAIFRSSRAEKQPAAFLSSRAEKQLATFLLERLPSARLDVGSSEFLGPLVQSSMCHDVLAESLQRLERVGGGASGFVHKARWLLGAEVAMKSFHGAGNPEFTQEVSILAGLNHPNIVSLFWSTSNEHQCHIIMELMDKDLHTLMDERLESGKSIGGDPPFTIFETLDISLQVAEGLLFLYDRNIVHRDIKSYNILTKLVETTLKTADGDIVNKHVLVKVADFGLSKTKEGSMTYTDQTQNVGSARWMAPEVIRFRDCDGTKGVADDDGQSITFKYPFQSDVYSFGMVCYEILTGRVPFSTVGSPSEVKKMVLGGLRPQLPEHCPSELKALIESCWSQEPSERPRIREICARLRELRCAYLITSTWAAWIKVPPRFSLDEIKITTDNLKGANSLKTVSYRKKPRAMRVAWIGVAVQSLVHAPPFGQTVTYEIWKGVTVDTGKVVAVDKILFGYFEHNLKVLPGIDHKNVVRCVGFCYEKDILLYEDMPTSTLSDWHEGDKKDVSHNWQARKTIAYGVAHGIHHLHTVPKIVHQAIQPDDILLNASMEPKLTGFGLSKNSSAFVYEKNFKCYLWPWKAPEIPNGKLSEKVDVYNYGLVLLEIVSGTRVSLPNFVGNASRVSFDKDHLERAWILHLEGRTSELIDNTLTLQPDERIEAVRMIHIAFLCLHSEPETRPDMNLVVEMLHGNQDTEIMMLCIQHGQDRDAGKNLS